MNRFILFFFTFYFSLHLYGQKIGMKYGFLGSSQRSNYDSKSKFQNILTSSYFGIEYEVRHRKPRIGNLLNNNNLYWIFELSYSTKGSKNSNIIDLPNIIRSNYLTFSPRILVFNLSKKNNRCRIYGCCDDEDYLKLKPYFNIYLGPKIDYLLKSNIDIPGQRKAILGVIASLNTQIICMSSGSLFTDIQFGYDFNNSFNQNSITLKNYFVLLAIGFKIRNLDNF